MRFLLIFYPFMVFSNVANVNTYNISTDKSVSHKALNQNVLKDFRKESKLIRLELKEYRQKIYSLQKERETNLELAKALNNDAKALKTELKEDIQKKNKLKKRLQGVSSEVVSLASNLFLGGDVTSRERAIRELAILEQQIKKKKKKIVFTIAEAKTLIRKRKIMQQEIAELREEMSYLKEERKAFRKKRSI